jgi:hypothetical protein
MPAITNSPVVRLKTTSMRERRGSGMSTPYASSLYNANSNYNSSKHER